MGQALDFSLLYNQKLLDMRLSAALLSCVIAYAR